MTWGEPGNSEVGHLTIGAGRIIFQALSKINKSIDDGSFFENKSFKDAALHAKKNNSRLHLVGLLSSGSIHSYFNHVVALLELASRNNLEKVYLHLFMDGKDSSPKSGHSTLFSIREYLIKMNTGSIATIIGREYAMDRNKNWDRTEKTYNLLIKGEGEKAADALAKLQDYYDLGYTDANIPPTLIDPNGLISANDSVIFFNFREDSMRQLVRGFIDSEFSIFPIVSMPDAYFASMVQYFNVPSLHAAFPNEEIKNGLSEVLAKNGKTHLHIAETEKYAHTTFFFNGLTDTPFPGETDIIIDSLKNPVSHPEMKANEITDKVIKEITRNFYDFIIINYANTDTLAHSGDMAATIAGVEAIDKNLSELAKSVIAADGILIITADHGHGESMTYRGTGEIKTGHALNPVPFILIDKAYERQRVDYEIEYSFSQSQGLLSDIAPTVLDIMKITKPQEMTGKSLLPLLIER